MNVWIANPFDNLPSEGNRPQRYWLMAEAFVRAGHRVTYWTSDFSHATKAKRIEVSRQSRRTDEIEVVQIPTLPYAGNICLARVQSHRKLARDFEAMTQKKAKARSEGQPDLIIASTPPLGLCEAAMRMARKCGAKFVCDIQDAWPETFERILPRWVWSALGVRAAAKRVYCGADGVSAVAERYVELAKDRGCTMPTKVFGHAIDIGRMGNFCGETRRREACLRLVYAGNMSLSYDLETLIGVVNDMPNVTLDMAGNGPDRPRLERLARHNVRFHGYLGERELARLLRACDVGMVPMFPESCVGVPGKLADYAASGLRVIESLGGECLAIVEKYGAGVHYTAGDGESLKKAVTGLSSTQTSGFDPSAFAAAFDARKIMDEYVTWCTGDAAIAGTGTGPCRRQSVR